MEDVKATQEELDQFAAIAALEEAGKDAVSVCATTVGDDK